MKEKPSKFKGYFLTVVCGLVVVAGTVFLILQFPDNLTAKVSIFGKYTDPPVQTIWVIALSALLGPVFLACCWWLLRGMWILYRVRRAETKDVKAADAALARAKDELQAPGAPAAPAPAPEAPAADPSDESDAVGGEAG